jgi:hypothetical protein
VLESFCIGIVVVFFGLILYSLLDNGRCPFCGGRVANLTDQETSEYFTTRGISDFGAMHTMMFCSYGSCRTCHRVLERYNT